MASSGVRRIVGLRVWAWMGVGLVLAGTAWAQPPRAGRAPRARGPVVPYAPLRAPSVRVLTAPAGGYDPCLVAAPVVDPGFVVRGPQVDDGMIAPARVAGLQRGTLAPRR